MRLLIVEDDALLGEFLQRMMREATWAVDWVRTGPAALEALLVSDYDLARESPSCKYERSKNRRSRRLKVVFDEQLIYKKL